MRTAALVAIAAVAFLVLPLPRSAEPPAALKHRVPPGFVIEQVAGDPDIVFPMFACFDDRGRLFVAESSGLDLYKELQQLTRKCRIRLLEDPDERGRFRKSTVWADGLVFPMGLAWRDGKLYVADPPDLVTLEDTDGDGKADKRTAILSGFGHKDNGSLHGLVFGPDGWLYFTMGDPDGYKLKRKDGAVVEGTTGALLRCTPDGSEIELLSSGFTNLVEVAFTPRGDVIGTDNWFQVPTGGIRDALIHCVPGGRYPQNADKPSSLGFSDRPLPPLALYPAVALSGLMRCEGTALGGDMQDNLFCAQHNSRKVSRHVLVPEGSTFKAQDFDFVTSDDPDFHPADVLEHADGSLYVLDTGSWYVHHCPTGQIRKTQAKGGIYRVRLEKMPKVDDPWGLKVDWKAPAGDLVGMLSDLRPVVRDRARQVLASRGKESVPALASAIESWSKTPGIVRAVWALSANPDESALPVLRGALNHQPDVASAAARALAIRRDRAAADGLVTLLKSKEPPVRLAAAEALARCGRAENTVPLLTALRGQPDRFEEHALVYALHFLADAPALQKALADSHPRVQQAALVLLDQAPRPKGLLKPADVIDRVSATDDELRQAALRILRRHPEWAEQALGLLRQWITKPALTPEEQAGLRDLAVAFQGQKPVQDLVATGIADNAAPAERRVLLLETVAQSGLAKLPDAWRDGLAQAIAAPDLKVRSQAVRTAGVLQVPQLDDALARVAEGKDEPAELRIEALRAVALRRPKLSDGAFDLLLAQLDDKADPLLRLAAGEVLGRSQYSDVQLDRLLQKVKGETLVAPAVLLPAVLRSAKDPSAVAVVEFLSESLRTGWRPGEAELARVLEKLPASAKGKADSIRELWKQAGEKQRARLAEFEPLLAGGDVQRGRQVFFGKKAACITCHKIGAEGGPVGPDLTKLGAIRAGRDILESIVLPSSTIAQGFDPYLVATTEGRIVTGVIARQTADAIVLRDSSGGELRLRRDQVQEMTRAPNSVMPEGLERAITREEFRDLLAFLLSLK